MNDRPIRWSTRLALFVFGVIASASLAAAPTVFWMAPQSNATYNGQMVDLIGPRAGSVVLRANLTGDEPDDSLASVVRRLKKAGSMPVLAYGFPNRHSVGGRSESQMMRGLDPGKPLATVEEAGNGTVNLLDVADSGVRSRMVEKFVAAKRELGVDGFALDLSIRTPTKWPGALARRCQQARDFCPRYASGMDAVFADLRASLGANAYLAYNGLFNTLPGQLEDQTKLLANTNGAAVEFFGLNPKEKSHAFRSDVLPYLQTIAALPKDRQALVFGRAPWDYTNFLADYEWQRYLYASFLLAARRGDMFKYHATFQVPTFKGRTSGIDYFADWNVDLGDARGPMTQRDGVYQREFARGQVAVAPDDGRGGSVTLRGTMYTLEGEPRQGTIHLAPGAALIALDGPPPKRPSEVAINADQMARWNLRGATLQQRDGRNVLAFGSKGRAGDGEYDVMLDWERSLTPYRRLRIEGVPGPGSRIVAVAEVDDRQKRSQFAIVEIKAEGGNAVGKGSSGAPIFFRTRTPKAIDAEWPVLSAAAEKASGALVVDEYKVFEGARPSQVAGTGPPAIPRVRWRSRPSR